MNVWRCLSCGGTYQDTNPDRTVYMHACGRLPPDKDGVIAPREDARDENIARARPGTAPWIKSEGKGVQFVKGIKAPEPLWITRLRVPHEAESEE